MRNNQKDLSILVLSCDKYMDLWDTFFEVFEKNWNNCEYDIYLGSNTQSYVRDNVNVLYTGEDRDWSSSARKIVKQINSKYILIFLEDMLVGSKVNDTIVKEAISFMNEQNGKHLHIRPLPKADKFIKHGSTTYGEYEKGMPYRVNVIALWEREYFLNLLIDGESPWNFEIMGSYRTSYDEGFFTLKDDLYMHINMVEKGKWIQDGLKWCQKNNISVDFSQRGQIKEKDILVSNIKHKIFGLASKISWRTRVKLMNILRKLLISY